MNGRGRAQRFALRRVRDYCQLTKPKVVALLLLTAWVGMLLAEGKTLPQAVESLGHVAEGVYSARTVLARARQVGVEMPITETVVALLDGQLPVTEAVQHLMARDPRGE